MLKHRSLTLHKFLACISPELLQAYFVSLSATNMPSGWELLNAEAMEQFLARPENAELETLVRRDLERVNDIADEGVGVILKAYKRYGLEFDQTKTTEENALRLFLDYPRAFDFAWSRFLLFASSSKLSVHPIERREIHVEATALHELQTAVSDWFSKQAKGEHGEVTHFEDEGDDIFLIRHGTYYRAFSHFAGPDLSVTALRLAVEDLMIFERSTGLLRIRATQAKDRGEYLRLFAAVIVGAEKLAKQAAESEVFTLTPIQDGTFDFNGSGEIIRVELKRAKLKLYGMTNPVVEVRSSDVLAAFQHDLGDLALNSGVLLTARFRFTIKASNKKPVHRTFDVTPPSHTSLPDKRETELILDYLEQQGVKVR